MEYSSAYIDSQGRLMFNPAIPVNFEPEFLVITSVIQAKYINQSLFNAMVKYEGCPINQNELFFSNQNTIFK